MNTFNQSDFRNLLQLAENSRKLTLIIATITILVEIVLIFYFKNRISPSIYPGILKPLLPASPIYALFFIGFAILSIVIPWSYTHFTTIYKDTVIKFLFNHLPFESQYTVQMPLSRQRTMLTQFLICEPLSTYKADIITGRHKEINFEYFRFGCTAVNLVEPYYTRKQLLRETNVGGISEVNSMVFTSAKTKLYTDFRFFRFVVVPHSEEYAIDNNDVTIAKEIKDSVVVVGFVATRQNGSRGEFKSVGRQEEIDSSVTEYFENPLVIQRRSTEKITTNDSKFDSLFSIYTNDKKMANTFFDVKMRRALINYKEKANGNVYFSLIGDLISFGYKNPIEGDMFEPSLFSSIDESLEYKITEKKQTIISMIETAVNLTEIVNQAVDKE